MSKTYEDLIDIDDSSTRDLLERVEEWKEWGRCDLPVQSSGNYIHDDFVEDIISQLNPITSFKIILENVSKKGNKKKMIETLRRYVFSMEDMLRDQLFLKFMDKFEEGLGQRIFDGEPLKLKLFFERENAENIIVDLPGVERRCFKRKKRIWEISDMELSHPKEYFHYTSHVFCYMLLNQDGYLIENETIAKIELIKN